MGCPCELSDPRHLYLTWKHMCQLCIQCTSSPISPDRDGKLGFFSSSSRVEDDVTRNKVPYSVQSASQFENEYRTFSRIYKKQKTQTPRTRREKWTCPGKTGRLVTLMLSQLREVRENCLNGLTTMRPQSFPVIPDLCNSKTVQGPLFVEIIIPKCILFT